MNPDIQRIAEQAVNKIYAECDEFWHDIPCRHRPKMEEIIGSKLAELSALRDTQERELREKADEYERWMGIATTEVDEVWRDIKSRPNHPELLAVSEEARRHLISVMTKWSTFAKAKERLAEDLTRQRDWYEVSYLNTSKAHANQLEKNCDLERDIASLRAELARRDEVEKELREKLSSLRQIIAGLEQGLQQRMNENVSLRSRIGELEAKYGVQEQLDHIFGQLPTGEGQA